MNFFEYYNLKKAKKRLALIKYLYKSVQSKYPIIDDSDIEEKETLLNALISLSEKLEEKINEFENNLISYQCFKDICEEYEYEYDKLTYQYPVLDAFVSIIRSYNIKSTPHNPGF